MRALLVKHSSGAKYFPLIAQLQDRALSSSCLESPRLCFKAAVHECTELGHAVKSQVGVIKESKHLLECLVNLLVVTLSTSPQEGLLDHRAVDKGLFPHINLAKTLFYAVVKIRLKQLFDTPCDLCQRHMKMFLRGELSHETIGLHRIQIVLDESSDNAKLHALNAFTLHRLGLFERVIEAGVCVSLTLHFEIVGQVLDSIELGLVDCHLLVDYLHKNVRNAELEGVCVLARVHATFEVVLIE